jgi:predicted cupin superfamily sugar epimerase
MLTQEQLINKLNLEKHPEGGYFRETYRSQISIPQSSLPSGFHSNRSLSTCIYFMLTSDEFSAFHKVNQDEAWHFYLGHPITLHMISPEGDYSKINIGNDFTADETPQFIVPAHYWFAAEVEDNNAFALVGCTVAPGFDFEDFELAEGQQLQNEFPEHSEVIHRLTR